jgi:hypothetical protein
MPSDLIRGWKPVRVKKTRQKKKLVLAVMGGVVTARLGVVMFGVAGMTVCGMGVVRRLFVIAGLVMLGGLAVMFCRMLVMLGGLLVMLDVGVFAHVALPVVVISQHALRNAPDTLLTPARQLCCRPQRARVINHPPRSRNRHPGRSGFFGG